MFSAKINKIFLTFTAVLLGLSLKFPEPAHGQLPPENVIDRATREVDQPVREEAEKMLSSPQKEPAEKEKEEEEPSQKEGPQFLLKSVTLEGCESVSPDEFDSVIERYLDREVSLQDLNILAKQIERQYLRKGVIAACFLPPQDVKEGEVTLRIIEAKMGSLKITDSPFFDKDRVRYYWNIYPGEVLRYDKMTLSLQHMNKNPDREVTATLHAGKEPGTTDVLLKQNTRFPIHLFYTFDREGAVSTGRNRSGFGVKDNNFLGVDDTFLTGYTLGKSFSGFYAYHSVPITPFGTSVMYGYSDSRSVPKKQFSEFGIASRSQNSSFYVHQDIYKETDYMGEFSFGLDANDKVTTTTDGTLIRDRFRILRAKGTFIHRYPQCITYIYPQLSQGVNMFGARSRNPLSSRDGGAGNTFAKFNFGLKHTRVLPNKWLARFNFKSQWAGEKLASQEQFALGGIDSIRGYPAQDYMADSGFLFNLELEVPFTWFTWIPDGLKLPYDKEPLKNNIKAVLFYDHGYGEKRSSISSERDKVNYASVGAGLRFSFFDQASLRLEWGFPLRDSAVTETAESRFHISFNFEDNFPEEFGRIKDTLHEESVKRLARTLVDKEINKPDSAIKKKLYEYLAEARKAKEKKDIIETKKYYDMLKTAGDSLYAQSEEYVRNCFAQQKELEDYNALAVKYYYRGDFEKAKELWQKIVDQAEIRPLVFHIQ